MSVDGVKNEGPREDPTHVGFAEYTLITMVKLHGRYGAHEETHELAANWEACHGAKPSVTHFTCLMSGCLRTELEVFVLQIAFDCCR